MNHVCARQDCNNIDRVDRLIDGCNFVPGGWLEMDSYTAISVSHLGGRGRGRDKFLTRNVGLLLFQPSAGQTARHPPNTPHPPSPAPFDIYGAFARVYVSSLYIVALSWGLDFVLFQSGNWFDRLFLHWPGDWLIDMIDRKISSRSFLSLAVITYNNGDF